MRRDLLERLEMRTLLSGTFDVDGVQPAALDQPQIHAYFTRTQGGAPLTDTSSGISSFDVPAFLDTGTSEILLSQETQQGLGINIETVNGQPVVFSDVGVAGAEDFNVSEPLYTSLAPFTPGADVDNPADYQTVYTQNYGPLRTEIDPQPADPNVGQLDVFGMPVMQGKVVVMDGRPLNDPNALANMNTYIYNPGTPYNAGNNANDPGIVPTMFHVKLSYGSFAQFTSISPANAVGPNINDDPFIGPDPVLKLQNNPPPDNTPPVSIGEGSFTSTGSFLFDTGAASSFISQAQAGNVHVHYKAGTYNTTNPVLVDDSGNPIPNQFTEQIGGVGGAINAAGFYLDSLTLPTMEGEPIRFLHAPVLVADVTVVNPTTNRSLTLDGDFGMNFLVASIDVSNGGLGNSRDGAFDWLTFDQPNGVLGLQPAGVPVSLSLSSQIGDGSAQRSLVKTVTLRFNAPVTLGTGALTLARRNTGGSGSNNGAPPTDLSADVTLFNPSGDGMTWIASFTPHTAATDASGGLADGIYDLTVHGSAVGNSDSLTLSDQTITFFRLFGDSDGNATVNNADYLRFKKAYGSSTGNPNFNPVLDSDNNGTINNADYLQFKKRYGVQLNLNAPANVPLGAAVTPSAAAGGASDAASVQQLSASNLDLDADAALSNFDFLRLKKRLTSRLRLLPQ